MFKDGHVQKHEKIECYTEKWMSKLWKKSPLSEYNLLVAFWFMSLIYVLYNLLCTCARACECGSAPLALHGEKQQRCGDGHVTESASVWVKR